ncbi:MAG TPA: hypothetical protein VKH37_09890 [Ferruginibacter sp.]|nr:hypothetical protein [Ferruginibacter sp.]
MKIIKASFVLFFCVGLCSCSNSFINHKLEYKKVGDCKETPKDIKMNSNINGERYEFLACADDDFDGKAYTVDRKGDSIIVAFPKSATKKQSLFSLTLDIDAKPAYHHIVLDGKEIPITQVSP